MKTQIETWHTIGTDFDTVPCFLTGAPPAYRRSFSGFVASKDAARHIVGMFGGNTRAGYYSWPEKNPTQFRIIVGVDKENKGALELLKELIEQAGGKISSEIINQVKKQFPVKPGEKIMPHSEETAIIG